MRAALAALRSDPDLGEPLHLELTGLSRVRVGEYRVVYEVKGRAIEVLAIGPRRTIYVDLERKAREEAAEREA